MSFLLFLPFIVILYFLFWRPQQQRVRRQQELIRAIEVGDQVLTAGGMIGRVVAVTDDRMHLEIADGVVIQLLRVAVTRRLEESEPGYEELGAPDDGLEEAYADEAYTGDEGESGVEGASGYEGGAGEGGPDDVGAHEGGAAGEPVAEEPAREQPQPVAEAGGQVARPDSGTAGPEADGTGATAEPLASPAPVPKQDPS